MERAGHSSLPVRGDVTADVDVSFGMPLVRLAILRLADGMLNSSPAAKLRLSKKAS